MSWLVYRVTGSVFLLGMVGFMGFFPTFILAPVAGVAADRWNRLGLLVATQTLSMIQALILASLVLQGSILVWHIFALSIFLGVVNAFDIPARQSFVVEMVENRDDLANAIALNSAMFNGARLLGPSIAGIVIAAFGEGICFLLNGISYVAVIAALLAMRIPPKKSETSRAHVLKGMKEGFVYTFGFPPIRAVLLLLALVSLMGMPFVVLMPFFAKDVLQGGPHTLGFLMAGSGAGSLLGALYLASRRGVLGLGRVIVFASNLFSIGLIGFSFSRVVWLSLLMLFITGFGMMVQMASINTILQTIVEDDKRGRVMSFYSMAAMGMTPFGSLLAGTLSEIIGPANTVLVGGASCLMGAWYFAAKLPKMREMVRPIYVERGILQEVATGLRDADKMDKS